MTSQAGRVDFGKFSLSEYYFLLLISSEFFNLRVSNSQGISNSTISSHTNSGCWRSVTGGSTGIGYETAKALYHLNGTVYITSLSSSSAGSAITSIKASSPHLSQIVPFGQGIIDFVVMDFSNLSTLQQAAKEFLSKVNRLDPIIHNACVMLPDNPDETTAQGWYQQLGINALAPFLLQLFLNPLVLHAASLPSTPHNPVRIIFLLV
jgi:NAD(P)-dependent dehydrogenase (short-subunit alcohol dehydrogenase family)